MDTPDKPNVAAVKAQLVAFTYEEVLEAAKLLDPPERCRLMWALQDETGIFHAVSIDAVDLLEDLNGEENENLDEGEVPYTIDDCISACDRVTREYDWSNGYSALKEMCEDAAAQYRDNRAGYLGFTEPAPGQAFALTEPGNAP